MLTDDIQLSLPLFHAENSYSILDIVSGMILSIYYSGCSVTIAAPQGVREQLILNRLTYGLPTFGFAGADMVV